MDITRYDVFIDYHKGEVTEVTIETEPNGEWVKYEDVQHILRGHGEAISGIRFLNCKDYNYAMECVEAVENAK